MIEFIKNRRQELITGLAELYLAKEDIETKITAQQIAIREMDILIQNSEKSKEV